MPGEQGTAPLETPGLGGTARAPMPSRDPLPGVG
eukprot:CAMPEP_0179303308 /NCGR_PEP_ID=MMETSP0797-20121207/48512_1 /TAXON_ID=47934 /ORGANISM="Dinophysis acuminata, Strain DAEP01" /LENGTH=33 /DNA_ID= /DNA_START= /DNA_END= /DNA_ORIENTATION=